ncbi:DUF3530 family protein [Spartinivicinus poritis]|uniref:DUF3530 family protein n=1 Tax=Spartinivicinus poritis TaxID=2994640 RepID=A0ABT5UCP3_9GAMM|nr:DUF3530 family protein [Spartinivicinus sp. A2-2]MDE1463213.1 DUF3530 family protein [Spartinivicinus sp. A2-2]
MFRKTFWKTGFVSLGLFVGCISHFCLAQQQTEEPTENQAEPATNSKPTEQSSSSDSSPSKTITRSNLPATEQTLVQLLTEHLPENELLMLPKEKAGETFLAAYLQENTGSPKGGILLIPAEGQHVNWPKTILPLRKELPNAGWHTLAIMPVESKPPPPPERTFFPKGIITLASGQQTVEAATSSDTEKSSEETKQEESTSTDKKETDQTADSEQKTGQPEKSKPEETKAESQASEKTEPPLYDPIKDMYSRINQGLGHLAKQGLLFQVIVGQREGAHWALAYLAEQKPENVHALIIINPSPSQALETTIPQLLEKSDLLTLDIYITQYPGPSPEANQRIAAAHRSKNYNYFQYRLPAAPNSQTTTNDWLFKRVKSWLKRRAKTTELSKRAKKE